MKDLGHQPLPVTPLTVEQRANEPFITEAFIQRLNEKVAARRAIMRTQGDSVQAVAVARFIVGGNDPKHEPWLSNMEPLIDEIDKLRAALTTAEAQATELRERLAGAEARATKAEGYAEHWEFVAKSTHETNLGLEHKLPLSTTAKPSAVELFRIKLSPKEAYGVRNCEGSMWHSYAGRLCRAAGYELPGTHTAELSNDNELIIKGSQPAAPSCNGACGICDCQGREVANG